MSADWEPRKVPKYSEFITSRQIPVVVGTENQITFFIHESLLVKHSEFMRKALEGPFIEATKKTLSLPEEDPEPFGYFVTWLYSRFVSPEQPPPLFRRIDVLADYVRLYTLSERLIASHFQHFILRLLHGRWDRYLVIGNGATGIGWKDESIVQLVDAIELMLATLIGNKDDRLQLALFVVWDRRKDGKDGWLDSPYFHKRLKENQRLEQQLKSHPSLGKIADIDTTCLNVTIDEEYFANELS